MDPITHGVLGAAAGYAVAGRRLGPRAAYAGGLAGMIPDLDMLLRPLSDPALPWEMHRHFTHALLFTPVGALFAWIPFLAGRIERADRRLLYLVCCLGYLSHSLLDNATSWGTLWYWPFSATRVALDYIAIVDPLFSIVILVGLVVTLRRKAAGPAVAGILIAVAYIGFGAFQHGRAAAALRVTAASRGGSVERMRVVPTLANVVLWRGLSVSGGMVHADAIRTPILGAARVEAGASLAIVRPPPGSEEGRVAEAMRRFISLADGYAAMTPDHPGVVGDMRYSLDPGGFVPLWGLRVAENGRSDPAVWVDLLEGGPSFPERVMEVLGFITRSVGR